MFQPNEKQLSPVSSPLVAPQANYPGVYTATVNFRSWIQRQLKVSGHIKYTGTVIWAFSGFRWVVFNGKDPSKTVAVIPFTCHEPAR